MMVFWLAFNTRSSHLMKVEKSLRYLVVRDAEDFLPSMKNELINFMIFSSLIVASMETGLLLRIPTKHS